MEVKNLKELIQPYLEKHGKTFLSFDCKPLLPTGENYGSTMLALKVRVQNIRSKEEEEFHCVAKAVPPTKAIWDLFNVPVTFKKEIAHYDTIIPTLRKFGRERGINNLTHFFPECLGARISLDPESNTVDSDAVIVLENLKVKGYVLGDRLTGFDVKTTKLVLQNAATLHGAVIAFKLANPDEFKAKILPNLGKGVVFDPPETYIDNLVNSVRKIASRNPACVPLLSRCERGVRKLKDLFLYENVREPFASFVHTDMWTNNMLIKLEDDEPVHHVFVDFQSCRYGSPLRDILFFLYSSVRLEIIRTKLDELLEFYYEQLIQTLVKLKCDVSMFERDLFLEEVDETARDAGFCHTIFMLTPLFTIKGLAKDMTEWTPDHMIPEDEEILHENYYERLHFTITDYAKRNWI